MKCFHDCIPCFINQTLTTVRSITDDEAIHEKVIREVLAITAKIDMNDSPPAMGQKIHKIIRNLTKTPDPYKENKRQYNKFAESLVPFLLKKIQKQTDLFEANLRVSIAGNIIDFGLKNHITEQSVLRVIEKCFEVSIDKKAVAELKEEVSKAKTILYLGDNAGEIVFDRLFIEQMPMEKIIYAVRGAPIINDITMEDADEVNMHQLVKVIDNGSDAPGTILSDCSKEFCDIFNSADLIIAKGQGNYETLSEVNKNIFFLLQAK